MKKVIIVFLFLIFSTSIGFASKPEYDAELSKIRTIKNAQVSALNKQIKNISDNILELELNTTLSISEKEKKMKKYTEELNTLTTKKYEISEQYKKDKAKLKKKYK